MIRALSSLVALALLSTVAVAQDDDDDFEPRVFNWTGFYIGASGGGAFSHGNAVRLSTDDVSGQGLGELTASSRGTLGKLEPEGWFAGGQLGLQGQWGHVVLGIEADVQGADINDRVSGNFTNPSGGYPGGFAGDARADVDWFSTLRWRAGWAFDRWLLYSTAGVAVAGIDYRLDVLEPPGLLFPLATNLRSDDPELGVVVGGGLEVGLTSRLSLTGGYQLLHFDDVTATGPVVFTSGPAIGSPTGETATSQVDVNLHTVRLGLNYMFGAPPPAP